MKNLPRLPLLIATAACSLAPAGAQTAWTATQTQGLSVANLVKANDLGPAASNQPLTVHVVLGLQNKQALVNLISAQNQPGNAQYGKFLSPSQFAAQYGASSASVSAVTSYLASQGFTGISVEPNHLIVNASGTVAQANAAFHTTIEKFLQNGQTVFGNLTAAQVPASLSGTAIAVLGLNNIGRVSPTLVKRSSSGSSGSAAGNGLPNVPATLNPQNFWTAYDVATVPAAQNATIAIIAEGDLTGVLSDLRVEEQANGLPQVPVTVVQVGLASTDTSGADEWDLDSQYSTGMAGTVQMLYMYDGTDLTDASLALEISRWATDGLARAASASLGECEVFPYLDGSMLATDEVLLQAASQGMSFFASTGDTGSFCPAGAAGVNGVPAGAPLVNWPASSEWATGVGGTSLIVNNDYTYDTEVSWYSGGGGISQFEASPYWQASANVPSAKLTSKGVPDIAYDADPDTAAANVYVVGAPEGVGGTSLSSPLALGTWARMISAAPSLGYAPLQFYSLYAGSTTPGSYPVGGFHDITIGANGLYTALPGWDYTAGLGTPDVAQMFDALTGQKLVP